MRGWARWLAVAALLLLAIHAIRVGAVEAAGEAPTSLASTIWPSHPDVVFASALAQIGRDARAGRAPSPVLLTAVERAAQRAPLATQPLLISAADRLADGDTARGERLLRAAIKRDARSPAPRFMLADLLVRQGRVPEAMSEIAALDRRIGGVATAFAPAIATYLAQPGGPVAIGRSLAENEGLRTSVLSVLAADSNPVAQLAPLVRKGDSRLPWIAPTLERLMAGGQLEGARIIARRSGADAALDRLMPWSPMQAPGGLGWRFPASQAGVVEAVSGGPLSIVFYQNADAVLAEHLLMLPPGQYQLSQDVGIREPADALQWRLLCIAPAGNTISTIPVQPRSTTVLAIAPQCTGQKLQLVGLGSELPRPMTADLRKISLGRVGQ